MNKRELRLALQEKLQHRRRLMRENMNLRGDLHRERERNEFLVKVLGNPLIDMALEECADEIMKVVIDHAVKASEVVASETLDGGDYVVGISIPSVYFKTTVLRDDVNPRRRDYSSVCNRSVRTIRYDG